jgi:hypothetical protein
VSLTLQAADSTSLIRRLPRASQGVRALTHVQIHEIIAGFERLNP